MRFADVLLQGTIRGWVLSRTAYLREPTAHTIEQFWAAEQRFFESFIIAWPSHSPKMAVAYDALHRLLIQHCEGIATASGRSPNVLLALTHP